MLLFVRCPNYINNRGRECISIYSVAGLLQQSTMAIDEHDTVDEHDYTVVVWLWCRISEIRPYGEPFGGNRTRLEESPNTSSPLPCKGRS